MKGIPPPMKGNPPDIPVGTGIPLGMHAATLKPLTSGIPVGSWAVMPLTNPMISEMQAFNPNGKGIPATIPETQLTIVGPILVI